LAAARARAHRSSHADNRSEFQEHSAAADYQRDHSRAKILLALGEPDLALDDGVAALAAERKTG